MPSIIKDPSLAEAYEAREFNKRLENEESSFRDIPVISVAREPPS